MWKRKTYYYKKFTKAVFEYFMKELFADLFYTKCRLNLYRIGAFMPQKMRSKKKNYGKKRRVLTINNKNYIQQSLINKIYILKSKNIIPIED